MVVNTKISLMQAGKKLPAVSIIRALRPTSVIANVPPSASTPPL